MTVDDGTPGLKRRLNLLAFGAAIVLIALARACALREPDSAAPSPAADVGPQGTSVSKDHGAAAGQAER